MSADDNEMVYKDHRDLTMHKFGNKAGKLLSFLTKEKFTPIFIQKIKTPEGNSTTDPKEINTLFRKYYETLHAKQPNNQGAAHKFLSQISLPIVTEEQCDTNSPITAQKKNTSNNAFTQRESTRPRQL